MPGEATLGIENTRRGELRQPGHSPGPSWDVYSAPHTHSYWEGFIRLSLKSQPPLLTSRASNFGRLGTAFCCDADTYALLAKSQIPLRYPASEPVIEGSRALRPASELLGSWIE